MSSMIWFACFFFVFGAVGGQQDNNAIDNKDDLAPLRVRSVFASRVDRNSNSRLGFYQAKTQFQRCITPENRLGHCMHLLRCPLPEFKTDKLRFMDYFCIIDRMLVSKGLKDGTVGTE